MGFREKKDRKKGERKKRKEGKRSQRAGMKIHAKDPVLKPVALTCHLSYKSNYLFMDRNCKE